MDGQTLGTTAWHKNSNWHKIAMHGKQSEIEQKLPENTKCFESDGTSSSWPFINNGSVTLACGLSSLLLIMLITNYHHINNLWRDGNRYVQSSVGRKLPSSAAAWVCPWSARLPVPVLPPSLLGGVTPREVTHTMEAPGSPLPLAECCHQLVGRYNP